MNQLYPASTLNSARYAETFAVFVARSKEYGAIMQRLAEVGCDMPPSFSLLDVGAGPGRVLRDWLRHSQQRIGRYVGVEPNPSHIKSLRSTIESLDLNGDVLAIHFTPDFPATDRFDFVLFSHSLYWLRDPVECVWNGFEMLQPGGVLTIFIQGPFCFYSLFHLFNPLLLRDAPIGADHGLSSHELVQGLRACGLTPEVIYDSTSVDLTGLFDATSERERDEFLSFLLQVEFAQLAEPLRTDAARQLRAACVEADGRLIMHHPNVTITLRRSMTAPTLET